MDITLIWGGKISDTNINNTRKRWSFTQPRLFVAHISRGTSGVAQIIFRTALRPCHFIHSSKTKTAAKRTLLDKVKRTKVSSLSWYLPKENSKDSKFIVTRCPFALLCQAQPMTTAPVTPTLMPASTLWRASCHTSIKDSCSRQDFQLSLIPWKTQKCWFRYVWHDEVLFVLEGF